MRSWADGNYQEGFQVLRQVKKEPSKPGSTIQQIARRRDVKPRGLTRVNCNRSQHCILVWLLCRPMAPVVDAGEQQSVTGTLVELSWAHGSRSVPLDDLLVSCRFAGMAFVNWTHTRLAQRPQIRFVIWDGNPCASIVRCGVNTTHKVVFILTAVLFQTTHYRQL